MEQRAESEKQKKNIGLIGPIIIYSPFSGRVPACGCGSLFGLLPVEGATQALIFYSPFSGERGKAPRAFARGGGDASHGNISSSRSEREGEAPAALLLEGATQAPLTEKGCMIGSKKGRLSPDDGLYCRVSFELSIEKASHLAPVPPFRVDKIRVE